MIIIKIAILSDIHGNIVALNAVLADAKKQGVQTYIIAGDLITDFPASNEVIDAIKELTPYVVKGNRENYILEYEKTKEDKKRWSTLQNRSISYFYRTLRKDNLEYIRSLPENINLTIGELTIKVVHASPTSDTQSIQIQNETQIEEITKELKEDILVCGHSHLEAGYVRKNNKIVITDGTVGMDCESEFSQYVILKQEKGKIEIETRNVRYDKQKLKEIIEENSQVLDFAYTWTNLVYLNTCYHKLFTSEFVEKATQKMYQKYDEKQIEEQRIYSNFKVIDDTIFEELTKEYEKEFLLKRRQA